MIEKQVAKLSDAQIAAELQLVGKNAADAASNREQLKMLYRTMVVDSLPQLANDIVDAGEMIPFFLKAKKAMKDHRQNQEGVSASSDSSAKNVDRAPAQSMKPGVAIFLGTVVLVVVLGQLFGWALMLLA